jgi:hypothetical protein
LETRDRVIDRLFRILQGVAHDSSFVLQISVVVDPLQESLGIRPAIRFARGPAATSIIAFAARLPGWLGFGILLLVAHESLLNDQIDIVLLFGWAPLVPPW